MWTNQDSALWPPKQDCYYTTTEYMKLQNETKRSLRKDKLWQLILLGVGSYHYVRQIINSVRIY